MAEAQKDPTLGNIFLRMLGGAFINDGPTPPPISDHDWNTAWHNATTANSPQLKGVPEVVQTLADTAEATRPGVVLGSVNNFLNKGAQDYSGKLNSFFGGETSAIHDYFTKPREQINQEHAAAALPQVQVQVTPFDPTVNGQQQQSYFTPSAQVLGTQGAESGGNLTARNPNSSAYGPGQFLDGTFLRLFKRYAAGLGPQYAQAAAALPDEQHIDSLPDSNPLKARVLALRANATVSGFMTQKLAEENTNYLTQYLHRPPSGDEVDLAHFLGAHAASSMIQAAPNVAAADVVSSASRNGNAAVQANHEVFFYPDGRPKTVAEVRQARASQFYGAGGPASTSQPGLVTTFPAPPAMQAFQAGPPPELAPPPQSTPHIAPDWTDVKTDLAAAQPTQPLTPEQIAQRKKAILWDNVLSGLATGHILTGPLAGYAHGKRAATEFEQGLTTDLADKTSAYNLARVSPDARMAESNAGVTNDNADLGYGDAMKAWQAADDNNMRRYGVATDNAKYSVQNANQNSENRWKWESGVAEQSSIQNLGGGAVAVTQGDPSTGQVTTSVQDWSQYMPGLKKQGAALGGFFSGDLPAETKTRLGALAVARTQGKPAVWGVVADEILSSPYSRQILGPEAFDKLEQDALKTARGDKTKAKSILIGSVANTLGTMADTNPQLLQQQLTAANSMGIVTAGALLGNTR